MFVRAGCLYTKVRASRGRAGVDGDGAARVLCDMCPAKRETLSHVIQQCPKTAHARTERHNSVLKLLVQKLEGKGYTVVREPAIKTDQGVRRPDCIAFRQGESAVVIDVTVVADIPGEISAAHGRKIRKYDVTQIRTWIAGLAGVSPSVVSFTSLTFNWRGALCKESAIDMKALGISMPTLEIMATRVLEWGHRAWREARDATWIRMDVIPYGTGTDRVDHGHGHSAARRRLAARPQQRPVGPLATGRRGPPDRNSAGGGRPRTRALPVS